MQLSRALLSDGASARAAPRFRFERLRHRTAEGVCLRQGSSSCVPPRRPSPLSLLHRWRAAATTTRYDQRSAPERNAQEQYRVSTTWGGLCLQRRPPRRLTWYLPAKEARSAVLQATPLGTCGFADPYRTSHNTPGSAAIPLLGLPQSSVCRSFSDTCER